MFLTVTLAHYFFPRHSNNHKAKLLHASTLYFLILSLLAYQVILQAIPLSGVNILGYASNIPPAKVIELTNQKRAEEGVGALEYNAVLAQAAKEKGEDMLAKDYWAHVSPDGTLPWNFFTNAGYKYKYAGENLARDFSDPVSAVAAWIASPSHKENLLSSKYQHIGVAVVEGELAGVETTLVIQLFGTPYVVDTTPQVPVASAQNLTTPAPTPIQVAEPAIVTETKGEVAEITAASPIGAATKESNRLLVSPFSVTRNVSLITLSLLLVILVVDGLIVANKKITRIGGRTFAHLAFLGMVLAIAIIAQAGRIL